jgi:FixJ family two-component response regulator
MRTIYTRQEIFTKISIEVPMRGHIVVVDDDEICRMMVARIVTSRKFHAMCFASAEAALQAIFTMRTAPKAIISDIHMAAIRGDEIAQRLMSSSILKKIPIILCSSRFVPGIKMYPKPFTAADFDECCREYQLH